MLTKLKRLFFKQVFYGNSILGDNEAAIYPFLIWQTMKVKGDIIECGVYRGGSLALIVKACKVLNRNSDIYGLDTFEGFPYDIHKESASAQDCFDNVDYNKLCRIFKGSRVKLIRGRFSKTLKLFKHHTFSFINLDCDLRRSYKECIGFLLPRMNKGGIMYFHDYNSASFYGCNEVIENMIGKRNLIVLPRKSAFYIK